MRLGTILCSLALLFFTLGSPASAHDYKLGDLLIDHPWARATIGTSPNGAAYMTITTAGAETDRLLRAESDVARRVELHTHLIEDGIMKMREVEAIEIAPGEPTLLKPGGLHVMLMGLTAPLEECQSFSMTLVFERAGRLEVEVPVEAATTLDGPQEMQHDHGS